MATLSTTTFDGLVSDIIHGDPNDLTPQHVLADWLEDNNDKRAEFLRRGISMWEQARSLKVHENSPSWEESTMREALADAGFTSSAKQLQRDVCLLGCLIAYHIPSGEKGKVLGQTWTTPLRQLQQVLWLIALQVLPNKEAEIVWVQADTAMNQAFILRDQMFALRQQSYGYPTSGIFQQADMGWRQADLAREQAAVVVAQADAARNLAYSVRLQAEAVRLQAGVVWRQADVARKKRLMEGRTLDVLNQGDQDIYLATIHHFQWSRACWESIVISTT